MDFGAFYSRKFNGSHIAGGTSGRGQCFIIVIKTVEACGSLSPQHIYALNHISFSIIEQQTQILTFIIIVSRIFTNVLVIWIVESIVVTPWLYLTKFRLVVLDWYTFQVAGADQPVVHVRHHLNFQLLHQLQLGGVQVRDGHSCTLNKGSTPEINDACGYSE